MFKDWIMKPTKYHLKAGVGVEELSKYNGGGECVQSTYTSTKNFIMQLPVLLMMPKIYKYVIKTSHTLSIKVCLFTYVKGK
jgi:hypothetical protein